MSKKNFAKKFVAYTMAFAVAFGTVNVSSIFVKDAQAATPVSIAIEADTTDGRIGDSIVNGNDVLLGDIKTVSSVTSEKTMKDTEIMSKTGIEKLIYSAKIVEQKKATTDTYVTDYVIDIATGKKLGNKTGAATSDIVVEPTGYVPVVFDGKNRVVSVTSGNELTESTTGNKNVELNMGTVTNGTSWYKIVKDTTSFTREYTDTSVTPNVKKTETIDVPYYKLVGVHDTTGDNGKYTITEVTKQDLGMYLGVELVDDPEEPTKLSDNYKLFNIYEQSDLVAKANQGKVTASVGGSAKLEVIATSTRKDLTYTWTKAGNKLDYTTASIDFAEVKDTDFGTYYCTVNDGLVDYTPVKIELAKASTDDAEEDGVLGNATTVDSVAKVLTDGTYGDKQLVGGKVTLTTTLPEDSDYRYIWTATMDQNCNHVHGACSYREEGGCTGTETVACDGTGTCSLGAGCTHASDGSCTGRVAVACDGTGTCSLGDACTFVSNGSCTGKLACDGTGTCSLGDACTFAAVECNHVHDPACLAVSSVDGIMEMAEDDEMSRVATDRSITLTPSFATPAKYYSIDEEVMVNCSVVLKSDYERVLKAELLKVNNASANTKYAALKELRAAEIGLITDVNIKKLYSENIRLIDADNKVEETETVLLGIGDKLELVAPALTDAKSWTWSKIDDDSVTGNTNTLVKNTVGLAEFGKYQVTVSDMKTSPTVVNKTFNVIYKSDLTATAEDITTKINTKNVELKVNATASLPIDYDWAFMGYTDADEDEVVDKGIANYAAVQTDNSIVKIAQVSGNHFFTAEKKDSAGEIERIDGNYFECIVTDGIVSKNVIIKVNQEVAFEVYDEANEEYVIAGEVQTITQPEIGAVKERAYTFAPTVKVSGDTTVEYSWLVGGKEVATTESYEHVYNGTNSPVTCKITDGLNTVEVVYTLRAVASITGSTEPENYIVTTKDMVYTGEELKGVVSVFDDANDLQMIEGTDYEVEYKENVNVGIARAEIKLIGLYKDVELTGAITKQFFIDRAENEVEIANVDVKVGEDVTPVVTKNLGKGNVTFAYYSDAACTKEVDVNVVKKTAGTYYVVATAIATANYNEAKSEAATVKVSAEDEEDDFVLGKTASIKAATTKSTSIKLAWEAVEGADAYRVYVYENGAYKVLADDLDALTFTAKNLTAGKKYVFAVKAFKDGKAAATFTKATLQTAPGVTSSIKVGRGYTSLKLTWNAVTGATGYRVYVAQDGKWVQVKKATTAKIFTKTGLKSGASYKFAVRAYRIEGSKVIWADTYKSVTAKTVKK